MAAIEIRETGGVDRTPPVVHLRIGRERRPIGTGGTFEHVNPATGRPDSEVPLAGKADIDDAVAVAHDAFMVWRETRPAERRERLNRLADLIEQHGDEFSRRGTLDNGTPISVTAGFGNFFAEWARYYAGWADKISSDWSGYHSKDGEISYSLAQPYGVIGVIITWNGILGSLAMKLPAALVAGNTVVVKPSELTPFSGELFADLVEEAGFPAGIVNVLPGAAEAGDALVANPLVKKVTFTGGPDTARKILRRCADSIKPVVLELGGKSANIIFDDADLLVACQRGTLRSVGQLSGQGCCLPTRMLVQDTIYDAAVATVAEIAGTISVGDPFDPRTSSGPVVNEAACHRILAMIERAKLDGARLVCGGNRLEGALAGGYFVEPTIFADVDPKSELAQKEVFGPVLAITPFGDEDEAIFIANCTQYELSAQVETTDLRRAHRLADELTAGQVLINGAMAVAPHRAFGGFGLSGYGKEGGRPGLDEFLQFKSVASA